MRRGAEWVLVVVVKEGGREDEVRRVLRGRWPRFPARRRCSQTLTCVGAVRKEDNTLLLREGLWVLWLTLFLAPSPCKRAKSASSPEPKSTGPRSILRIFEGLEVREVLVPSALLRFCKMQKICFRQGACFRLP